MATMTVRRTCALDPEAAKTVRDLAARWNASQAEVIRHDGDERNRLVRVLLGAGTRRSG